MRKTLLLTSALTALVVVDACGTASAINNNLHSDAIQKPPAANQTNVIVRDHRKPASKPSSTSTQPATSTTQSAIQSNQNSAATQPGSGYVLPGANPQQAQPAPKPPTPAEAKKDFVKRSSDLAATKTDLNKTQNDISVWQKDKNNDFDLNHLKEGQTSLSFAPNLRHCDTSGNCTVHMNVALGNSPTRAIPWSFDLRVDANGHPLPGELDRMAKARSAAYDQKINQLNSKIAADQQKIQDDQKQMGADSAADPALLGGSGGVKNGTQSTALHQN